MRIYDPRVGRFLSLDPVARIYPELTPYQFASNRPIDGVDQDGKEWELSTVSTFQGKSLVQKTNEFIVKINVINLSNVPIDELKKHLAILKDGAEHILQNTFTTKDKNLEIKNSAKIEFTFDRNANRDQGFNLITANGIKQSLQDEIANTVTLAQTRENGNTKNNEILFSIDQAINVAGGTVPNGISRQQKNLAEEILHTGSLGHVGIKYFDDRPDEKDADIMMFTPVMDPATNVMIQRGQNGYNSTTNVFQFQKVEKQVRKGNNVKEEKRVKKSSSAKQPVKT